MEGGAVGHNIERFGLIWFSDFRGEDLNVNLYQNMPNLHNRYKSAERKISQKLEKKYAPALDNYGQSCVVRSDF
jgi:predicted choloylglycine hydrolase